MLKILAIGAAVVSLSLVAHALVVGGLVSGAYTSRDLVLTVLAFGLCLAQLPALYLRRWGISLGALAMAVALPVLDRTVLNPPPDCSKGCTFVLKSDA